MTQPGAGGGTFKVAVLNKISAQFHALPECVRASAESFAIQALTDTSKVDSAEGQQLASGLSHDTKQNIWYFVSVRFAYDPTNHTIVLVRIDSMRTQPMN